MTTVFRESSAHPRVESVPLAHLSIELGHLYMEDFTAGPERLKRHFAHVAFWVKAARDLWEHRLNGRRARISTCFLIDDYFTRFSTPAVVIPQLLEAATEHGLTIDYLARESGCAEADGVPLAQLVEGRLVPEPPAGMTGFRPPLTVTGWLSNGERSPSNSAPEAMEETVVWRPPIQNAANRHSIFVDVELWDEHSGQRTWSCPFLAAVWQLLRLGMLRYFGKRVSIPRLWEGDFPTDWDELPALIQLNPAAAPFSAYHTLSVLARRFLPIEHAVHTILSQVRVEESVLRQSLERARAEGLELPAELTDRIEYVFTGDQ